MDLNLYLQKKAVFRDKFGDCHVVVGASESTWLVSEKQGYLYRYTACIVVHGKKRKRKGKLTKEIPVFVDKPFAFRGKSKQELSGFRPTDTY